MIKRIDPLNLIKNDRIDELKRLLEDGLDPDFTSDADVGSRSLLCYSASNRLTGFCELLLSFGAKDKTGGTALDIAIELEYNELAAILIAEASARSVSATAQRLRSRHL